MEFLCPISARSYYSAAAPWRQSPESAAQFQECIRSSEPEGSCVPEGLGPNKVIYYKTVVLGIEKM